MSDWLERDGDGLDRELEARLKAAFDGVEPDADASARMLTALVDAEAMRRARDGRGADEAAAVVESAAKARPRFAVWKVAAPVAAVLVVAAIGIGVVSQGGPRESVNESAGVSAQAVSEDAVAYEGIDEMDEADALASGMAEESAPGANASAMADGAVADKALEAGELAETFSFVTLADGTELAVESEEAADVELIGEQVAAVEAFDASGTQSVPCTVYEYEGTEGGSYAVVYDGEPEADAHIARAAE